MTPLRKPAFAALLALVFSLPLENTLIFPGTGTISRVVGLFALLLGILSLFLPRQLGLRRPSLFLAVMALFTLWSIASYFWSIDADATLERSLTFIQLFAMVWLIWQLCRSFEDHLAILQAYVLGAVVATNSSLANFVAGDVQDSYNRFSATGFDPNDFATTLALAIPMAWFLTSAYRHRALYWLNLLYIPWAIFVIILSASRGGFLVTTLALSIVPLTYTNLTLWRKLGFLLVLIAGTYLLFNLGDGLQNRLAPSLERLSTAPVELTEGTLNDRTKIWAAGLEVFMQSPQPWAGLGSGTFRYAVEPLLDRDRSPHNTYLSVLVDLGFIGLSLLLVLFVIALLPVLHTPQRAFYVVLFVTLLVALVPLSWETNKPMWLILSLLTTREAFVLESRKRSFIRAWG